ncbi:capsular polysaccharide synthesis protein [Sphingomonas quercus]|uniref:Capsular polysaccharide synthesis protein n=1 Tax=Sphingomonas quercus TaxID=2842451 RepID=A0ABS6BG96_9SPHN|nr:capsular polysaccharide synthesis protein [Sphingomonas quercus]MBU3077194.1 capsular polysaccharide synthesis protein [Sphingomonas quercus]
MPKAPGLETYSRAIARDNLRLHISLSRGGEAAQRAYFAPFIGHDIPKIVWIFWAQGESAAPPLVRRCIRSWQERNPGWDVRVLTSETVGDYADISDVPKGLALYMHADLLRLRLLAHHGGVWADATAFCHRPLDDWMPLLGGQTGFFVFGGPWHDRWIDNWFIAANPDSPLIQAWAAGYTRYVMRLTATPQKYFMHIYTLQWAIRRSKSLRWAFNARGSLPAVPAYFLQRHLEGLIDAEPYRRARAAGFPVSKLNWRLSISDEELAAKLEALGL